MKVYRSKIDAWLVIVVYAVCLLSTVPVLFLTFSYTLLIITLLLLGFISMPFLGTRYIIEGTTLLIQSAPFTKQRYDILAISSISNSNNPISSPALSLDRIKITFNNRRSVLISPAKKEDFLRELQRINPHIVMK